MNTIFFGLKRAYHGTLRVTRRALARLGLTAARFDLLYILAHADDQGLPQRELRRALGVAGSTVSRMLRSLEELGLILRGSMEEDLRCAWVHLTQAGLRSVQRAARLLLHTGHVQLAVDSALCPEQWHDEAASHGASDACDQTLRRMRHAYGDVATLDYPAHPTYVPLDLKELWALLDRMGR